MDKATGFRAALVLVAAIVIFALIAVYHSKKASGGQPSERFNASLQPHHEYPTLTEPYASAAARAPSLAPLSVQAPPPARARAPSPASLSVQAPPQTDTALTAACGALAGAGDAASVLPSEPLSNEQYRAVDYTNGGNQAPASAFPGKRLTAEDLLPKDAANTKWAQVTPSGQGELKDLNFMTAGWHIGVNTQGQTLRNANLQLRSDPVNPQFKVSPWNMSTMEPDVSRRPFEIA